LVEIMNTSRILIRVFNLILISAALIQCFGQSSAFFDTVWVRRYNGPGNAYDKPEAIAVDVNGNVYVSGWSRGYQTMNDYATIKYDSMGSQLWVNRYDGPISGFDNAWDMVLDPCDNVLVTGESPNVDTNLDYVSIKYSSTGEERWVRRYDGMYGLDDVANKIVADSIGNIFVTGYCLRSADVGYCATIKYDSMGTLLWDDYFIMIDTSSTCGYSISFDMAGNIYIAGQVSRYSEATDIFIVKYNSDGNEQWFAIYDNPEHSNDYYAQLINSGQYIYICGASFDTLTNFNYLLAKYDSSGTLIWERNYDGFSNYDITQDMAIDNVGNIIVTGRSRNNTTDYDFATLKYDSSGNQKWVKRYNGPGNGWDEPSAITIDSNDDIYITGCCTDIDGDYDYVTIKYDTSGNLVWVRQYNGPVDNYDYATDIAVDDNEYVYVTGESFGSGGIYDYATIKYAQYTPVEECYTENKRKAIFIPTFINDKLWCKLNNNDIKKDLTVRIYDVSGSNICSFDVKPSNSCFMISDNRLKDLSQGIYFVNVYVKTTFIGRAKVLKP
jgi:uncharacterized delta-60 repeat protein